MTETTAISKTAPATYDDEIDLRELFCLIWGGKWIVLGTTLIAAVISVIYALSLPNFYRAEALLAPASSETGGGLGALASQYGGLASLAGVNNLGGLGRLGSEIDLGIEVLQSRKFIGDFVERHSILEVLMAVDSWDSVTNQLNYDENIYDAESLVWVRQVKVPKKPRPSSLEAYERFREILSVSQDSDTGFIRVGIEHYSPHISKQWVDWLVSDINSEIRMQAVREAENSIAYLQSQLSATALSELQAIFYELIEEQTKTIMLANVRPEYLFRTIDPAVVMEQKAGPRRAIICVLGSILGGVLGVGLSLVYVGGVANRKSEEQKS